MPEPQLIKFTFKEIATLMVKQQGIKEGHWGIYVRFGISAANIGSSAEDVVPAAVVPLLELGLQRFEAPSSLTVDAAAVWVEKPSR